MNNKPDNVNDFHDSSENTLGELFQCSLCLRQMRQEVFVKHPNVCSKNPSNKRHVRVYDMSKYRSVKVGDQILPIKKVSSVIVDRPDCINARPSQTRNIKRDRHSDSLVPPVIDNFCCPICKRKFCEKAYDRHVAYCSNKLKNIPQSPTEDTLMARLRLDRRIKFSSNRISSKTSPYIAKPISTSMVNKQNSTFSLSFTKKIST